MSVALVEAPFEPGVLLAAFTTGHEDVGAVVSFTGLCRRDADVQALDLEAYPGFTESEITRIAEAVVEAHGLAELQVVHRIGRVPPGEAIVFVAAAAAHRRAAFDGADQMMDWLKSRAPFWKKSIATDGASAWIEPRPQDHADAARWDAPAAGTDA